PAGLPYRAPEDSALTPDRPAGIDTPLRGRFHGENALAAMAGARLLGGDDGAVARGIEAVGGVPGRFESVDEGQPFTVIVDYAHTPDSLENVLATPRAPGSRPVTSLSGSG